MRTSKFTFTALAAAAMFSLSGCITINSSDSAQPQPSVTTVVATPEATTSAPQETQAAPVASETPVQAIQPPAPEPAPAGVAPGTSCGLSNTGASTLVVAENEANLNCDQVQSIFAEFNATFTSGDTSNYQIQGFTCHTRTPEEVEREGRSVSCKQGGTRLEAMTRYELGGIPVENPKSIINAPNEVGFISGAEFSTSFATCSLGGAIDTFSFGCIYFPPGSDPVDAGINVLVLGTYHTPGPYVREALAGSTAMSPRKLPVGQSFSYHNVTCINNGDSLTCTHEGQGFTITPTSHSFF